MSQSAYFCLYRRMVNSYLFFKKILFSLALTLWYYPSECGQQKLVYSSIFFFITNFCLANKKWLNGEDIVLLLVRFIDYKLHIRILHQEDILFKLHLNKRVNGVPDTIFPTLLSSWLRFYCQSQRR